MFWLWLMLGIAGGLLLLFALLLLVFYRYLIRKYRGYVVRIFQEKPLFIVPRGKPVEDVEEVRFLADERLTLCGCYFKARTAVRKGVILFGLEFGSNRWAAVPYCDFLRTAGYDIFTFEFRCQGDSDAQPGYEPLQWVTEYELRDFRAALAYLKGRADSDPRGVGLFGISKGASAGLLVAAEDSYLRCFVTDGAFGTHTTMLPYMRRWIAIYNDRYLIQKLVPNWLYLSVGASALRVIQRERKCTFPRLEKAMGRLGKRPLMMIHGGGDTYIKPEMAEALYALVRGPKSLWLVEKAKHNQSLQLANGEYQRRVLEFFDAHLASPAAATECGAALVGSGPASGAA